MALWFRPETLTDTSTDTRVLATLDKLLTRTHFSEWPWLPSYWLSTSVLQWAEGAVTAAGFFLLVLLSHVLFFGYLSFTCTGKLFYDSFSIVQSRQSIFVRWAWFRRWRQHRPQFDFDTGPIERATRFLYTRPCRCGGIAGQGRAHVLARHYPMGPDPRALRPAGRLCHQSAPLLPGIDQSLLGAFGLLSKSGRLRAEPGHAHAPALSSLNSRWKANACGSSVWRRWG